MFEIKNKCMMNFKLLGFKIVEIYIIFFYSFFEIGVMVLEKMIFEIFMMILIIMKENRDIVWVFDLVLYYFVVMLRWFLLLVGIKYKLILKIYFCFFCEFYCVIIKELVNSN